MVIVHMIIDEHFIQKRQFSSNTIDFNSVYTKDSWNVYFMGKKVDGASAMTFKPLNYGYAKDAFNVFFMG